MEKSKIDGLYRAIKKNNYQKIHEIYNLVKKGEIFSKEDIEKLFNIFMMEWNDIEPWEYHKIQDMIFLSLEGEEIEKRVEIFTKNIIKMILNCPEHVGAFFTMMKYSFDEQQKRLFSDKIKELKAEKIINQYLEKGYDELQRLETINRSKNIEKYIEVESLGEFKFTNPTRLEKDIKIEFFQENYPVPIVINCKEKWEVSEFLKSMIVKFMRYLEQNKEKLENDILKYYKKEVRDIAENEGWIKFYTDIHKTKDLRNVMEVVGIDIDDLEEGIEFQIIFGCDWEDDGFMIQINQRFEVEKIGTYC